MDFATVKSLAIPEGDVTKITNASGTVLWQKSSIDPALADNNQEAIKQEINESKGEIR